MSYNHYPNRLSGVGCTIVSPSIPGQGPAFDQLPLAAKGFGWVEYDRHGNAIKARFDDDLDGVGSVQPNFDSYPTPPQPCSQAERRLSNGNTRIAAYFNGTGATLYALPPETDGGEPSALDLAHDKGARLTIDHAASALAWISQMAVKLAAAASNAEIAGDSDYETSYDGEKSCLAAAAQAREIGEFVQKMVTRDENEMSPRMDLCLHKPLRSAAEALIIAANQLEDIAQENRRNEHGEGDASK